MSLQRLSLKKGYLEGVEVHFEGKHIALNFYDAARFVQDLEYEVDHDELWYLPRTVIVKSVSRKNIESAATSIIQRMTA